MTLAPERGFDWSHVSWGRPDSPLSALCSYCSDSISEDDLPLILWSDDGHPAQFCETCAERWWGMTKWLNLEHNPDRLEMWTVYDHPKDHPDSFVARRWTIGPNLAIPTDDWIEETTLEELRERMIEAGRVCIRRSLEDDPAIVETWV
jgi:hypothetical protein